jgi:glyoxylase-like metal-dependent hydrolase (beta-lactamase superfamily II)
VVFDPDTRDALILDPVWNYDPAASRLSEESLFLLQRFLQTKNLRPRAVLETHAHADHVTSSARLKNFWPALQVGIGRGITRVQSVFKGIYDFREDFQVDGSQFDLLLDDGGEYTFGSLRVKVLATPGHTPACVSYVVDRNVFVGDLLFMPDSGTGRCDFPLGSARDLYQSVTEKIYTLPDGFSVYTGHDYQPGGRELRFRSTVAEQKQTNTHLKAGTSAGTSMDQYITFRTERDKTLKAPRLLLPSLQINLNGGRLRPPSSSGRHFLKIPVEIA